MTGFRKLEIYKQAFELAIRIHRSTLKLPKFELYEQGSQIRRSSKTIKDTLDKKIIRYLEWVEQNWKS